MKKLICLMFTALFLMSAAPLFAEEAMEVKDMQEGQEAPAMDEAQMEMMENFKAYSTPGDMHAELAKMIGSWNAEVKHWMAPDAPVEISQGTADLESIFGGRFVQQEFSSEWMGQPFQGLGLFGYDNIQQKFQSIWLDSMATGIMFSSGEMADNGTMVETGEFSCPLTNGVRKNRSVTTFIDDDTFTYEMYMEDENGAEFLSMIITYTRS